MDRKQIDKFLIEADKVLKNDHIKIVENNQIVSTFVAYVAMFGTAVIQNGLLPALTFFSAESENGVERYKIIQAISWMLTGDDNRKSLLNNCIELQHDKDKFVKKTKEIVNASIALKMMMRTYKLVKNEDTY